MGRSSWCVGRMSMAACLVTRPHFCRHASCRSGTSAHKDMQHAKQLLRTPIAGRCCHDGSNRVELYPDPLGRRPALSAGRHGWLVVLGSLCAWRLPVRSETRTLAALTKKMPCRHAGKCLLGLPVMRSVMSEASELPVHPCVCSGSLNSSYSQL